jgi:hypothetical protein
VSPQRPIDSPGGSALSPEGANDSKAAFDIAPSLTVTIDGSNTVGAHVDLDATDLGPTITAEVARGLRPGLDDPTRLTNGALNPHYAEWVGSRTWHDQHPLNEYLMHEDRRSLLVDDRGYFDRKRVGKELGPSGWRYWLVDGSLPTKAKIPVLAQLLGAPVGEVEAVVEQELLARDEYRSMISRCRTMPYRLLTYDQIRAGVLCPGCGRPWTGRQEAIDTNRETWRAMHGECRASRNGYTDGPVHCMRCCGVPAPSPEQLAAITMILQEAATRQQREEQRIALESPEVQRQRQEQTALKRAKRITKLEVELARLREEQAQDGSPSEGPDFKSRSTDQS